MKNNETETKLFDQYPFSTIFIENITMALWLVMGFFILYEFMPALAWFYLVFSLLMMLVVMRIIVCKNCYYHGKWCHVGWGKLSAIYCKKGNPSMFGNSIGVKAAPFFYMLISIIPLMIGILSLIQKFSFQKLLLLTVFLVFVFLSSVVFRKRTCSHCKMKNDCPGAAVK